MIDPLAALLSFLAFLAMFGLLFWPDRGVFWRWRELGRMSRRVLTEDALKHLHDHEYRGRPSSVQSLAGALSISIGEAAELIRRIELKELLTREGEDLRLTPEGRAYALRIIRVHRLWERHLAEETGVREEDWHVEAERREHTISPEEAEELAARMGHPRYDPHGDPIPTPSGDLPPYRGEPLTALPVGEVGAIVHLEDEPREIYSQLIAEDLHPGMRVQMLEVSPDRVCFWADGDEHVLAPVVAANVSFVPLAREENGGKPLETLAALSPGESARVVKFAASCRGLQRRRLMDLGLLPDTEVVAEMSSASGDPMAYRIRGSLIALRRDQAKHIQIVRSGKAH